MHENGLFRGAARAGWIFLVVSGLLALVLAAWPAVHVASAVEGPPDLSPSTKLVEPGVVEAGGTLTYTLWLTNAGGPASAVLVSDTLPAEVTFRPGSLNASDGLAAAASGIITWTGAITGGASVTITWQVDVTMGLTDGSTVTNTAQIDDGVTGTITRTAAARIGSTPRFRLYLPLVLRNHPPLPAVPVLLDIANPDYDGSYEVVWQPAARAQTYVLEEDTSSAFSNPHQVYAGPDTQVALSGRQPGVYAYRVRAVNSWGSSGWSETRLVLVTSRFHGRVTFGGAPAAGIRLDLAYFTGHTRNIRLTATTDADGRYEFSVPPTLSQGEIYGVEFVNSENTGLNPKENYLAYWGCNTTGFYPTPVDLTCDFDIAAVQMTSPRMLVSPPVAFAWTPRPATPEDTYAFVLWDPGQGGARFTSPDLGHAGGYVLASLPSGFAAGRQVDWWPEVRNRYGAGRGYYLSWVWFGSFADDFSNPNSGWMTSDDQNGRFAYVSGEYQILGPQATFLYRSPAPFGASLNYALEVDARRATAAAGAYGFVFAVSDNPRSYYVAAVDPKARQYFILKYDGAWTQPVLDTTSNAIKADTASNHLKLVRNGATIEFYANGQHLVTITDNSLAGLRNVGLVALADQNNFDARFDNFSATVLTSGPTAMAPAAGGRFDMEPRGAMEWREEK